MDDCYYYADKIGLIKPICLKCYAQGHGKNKSRIWFWPGSTEGYGDVSVKCSVCKKEINAQTNI